METIDFRPLEETAVYIILGIDAHEHDQVLGVCQSFELAKRFCMRWESETEYFDLWIERHPVIH